ncbi:hypothetical protein E2C01_018128 [Portunus trituberculatus]|uniref:Uncharacterized protein n=1 Tax=Portunus trituberculatus TaxID=210409 RepID=A0A5B7DVC5_PORTR|nr:hypothetical protein [Portunus trituberculatus]
MRALQWCLKRHWRATSDPDWWRVAPNRSTSERRPIRGGAPGTNSILRYFPARVGSSSGRFSGFRSVDCGGAGVPHKSSGAFGSLSGSPVFSGGLVRVGGVCDIRQLDSGCLSQEVWGHLFRTSVGLSRDGSPMLREPFRLSMPCFRSRTLQFNYRCAQSGVCCFRVDPTSRNLQESLPGVGVSSGRSVCHGTDPSSAPVCISSSRSGILVTGCILFSMGRSGSVRLSTVHSDPPCSGEGSRVAGCTYNASCCSLASGRLVSRGLSSWIVRGFFPSGGLSFDNLTVPSSSGEGLSSRVVTLQHLFRAQGFSLRAAKFMSCPIRQSSASVCQVKWRVFCG